MTTYYGHWWLNSTEYRAERLMMWAMSRFIAVKDGRPVCHLWSILSLQGGEEEDSGAESLHKLCAVILMAADGRGNQLLTGRNIDVLPLGFELSYIVMSG
jgi:hypothetical protein